MILPLVTLFLLGGAQLASGAAIGNRPERRGVTPKNPYDDKTTSSCTWWHDYNEQVSCDEILSDNQITLAQFRQWNPSITASCGGLTIGRSYCVEAAFVSDPDPQPSATSGSPTEPTTTKPPNGIETPEPTQPDIVSNCDKFYLVKSGDSCAAIASKNGITVEQLTTWNPKVGTNCAGLWADAYACVSIIGHEPTPTNPGNGIETPEPTQPDIVSNCDKFYLVKSGDSCDSIASKNGITVAQFTTWNPKVGSNCAGLWADAYACVSIVGHEPSPTNPGNGIETPTPTQPDIVSNCDKFYLVKSGDSCATIASNNGITLAQFTTWNPKAGSNCSGLWANAYACVSIIGHEPTPTTPGNGVSTPSPIQDGMTKSCNKFHLVKSGETCSTLQTKYSVTLANFYKWNPAIGSDCRGMWAETYLCVGVLS